MQFHERQRKYIICTFTITHYKKASNNNPTQTPLKTAPTLTLLASLFLLEVVEVEVAEPDIALNIVVTTVVVIGDTVDPTTVDPEMVLGDTFTMLKLVTAPTATLLDPDAPEIVVVVGSRIVSGLVLPAIVTGGSVDAEMVDPGSVVVYVMIISLPKEDKGIAEPTPEEVN